MLAKYSGKCGVCGKSISVGDDITWSRQPKTVLPFGGKVYHKGCSKKLAELEAAAPVPASVPVPDAAVLAELIKKLMATSGTAVAEQEPEPKEEDYAPEPVKAKPKAKPATTTASKLTRHSPWFEVFKAVLPFVNRILLVGPPSTGKSTTAMKLADTKHRITMTETTSREDLIGMHHLIDGATKFVGVNFTTAMADGAAVMVDEIDRYSPESASLAYSLIDDKPHVNLPTGELVEAKDGYKVIMTTNETLDTLPPAVQDRIEIVIMASTPHVDALDSEGITDAMKAVCNRYYSALPVPSIKLPPTVRRMRVFGRLMANGIPNDVAARLVFGNGGAAEVLSAITSAEGTVK